MIPQIEPWIGEEELKEVAKVIKSTWITEWEKTKQFEEAIKQLTKAKYAHAFCNGTAALFTALKVLGIKEGDEVIVPDLTFIASSNSIIFAGAKPVFVDVDKRTFNLDPSKIEDKITDSTKAIMPVHLYGQSADMDAIIKIAKKHNLFIVEDAAQGIGVKFNKKHVGTFGDIGVLSFYGNKTITTGEGGVILTDNGSLALDSYQFKNHGRAEKGVFIHEKIGFNFSFTDLQAALGLAQLSKLTTIITLKSKIREAYIEQLSDIQEVEFTFIDTRCSPVHWFTNILVDDAEKLLRYLKEKNIGTRRFFYPLNMQPCYNIKGEFPNTEYAYQHGLSLPSSATLKQEDILKICGEIRRFYRHK